MHDMIVQQSLVRQTDKYYKVDTSLWPVLFKVPTEDLNQNLPIYGNLWIVGILLVWKSFTFKTFYRIWKFKEFHGFWTLQVGNYAMNAALVNIVSSSPLRSETIFGIPVIIDVSTTVKHYVPMLINWWKCYSSDGLERPVVSLSSRPFHACSWQLVLATVIWLWRSSTYGPEPAYFLLKVIGRKSKIANDLPNNLSQNLIIYEQFLIK